MNRWFPHIVMALLVTLGLAFATSAMINPRPDPSGSGPAFTRITGADMPLCAQDGICAIDLGIPFKLENGSIGYLGGDTFKIADPAQQVGLDGWRAPVMVRSSAMPTPGKPLPFDNVAGDPGTDLIPNGHGSNGEQTVIPTDGISFSETGAEIISYESIKQWQPDSDPEWLNNYAGLAWSPDGNHFYRIGPTWAATVPNNPYQVWSMQRDGEYVYIVTVRAGRQKNDDGPMMLLRVPWRNMLDQNAYECRNGDTWQNMQTSTCTPILHGSFGEPSLRLLADGKTWALSYLDVGSLCPGSLPCIVTQTASSPTGPWTAPKVQVTWAQNPHMYGGYIHPWSTPDNLILMVSTWIPGQRYDVSFYKGSLQSNPPSDAPTGSEAMSLRSPSGPYLFEGQSTLAMKRIYVVVNSYYLCYNR